MAVEVEGANVDKYLSEYNRILAFELKKEVRRIAEKAQAEAREFNRPDRTGQTDAEMVITEAYVNMSGGQVQTIRAVFYAAPKGDQDAWLKVGWLEHKIGQDWRGQFVTPARENIKPRLRRAATLAAGRARRRFAKMQANL